MMATVALRARRRRLGDARRQTGVGAFGVSRPRHGRIWWTDVGVHQNLTFPVHPDPISGMHCWHQAVRVRRAEPGDAHGDIAVDTAKAREVYQRWMRPDAARRAASRPTAPAAHWLLRPLKPAAEAFALPGRRHPRRRDRDRHPVDAAR